jgi:hypothetical protein
MPYFIFNDSTGKQRADFYQDQLSEEILWQGESADAFIAETGFSIAQLGGFVLEGGTLTFDQALKDAHDAPQEAVKTPQDKLRELTAFMSSLDIPTQASYIAVSGYVETALNAGNVSLADFLIDGVPTTDPDPLIQASKEQLKSAILAILRS